eukprot:2807960-Rhodomonas_salina.2
MSLAEQRTLLRSHAQGIGSATIIAVVIVITTITIIFTLIIIVIVIIIIIIIIISASQTVVWTAGSVGGGASHALKALEEVVTVHARLGALPGQTLTRPQTLDPRP